MTARETDNIPRGIFYICAASFMSMGMSAAIKWMSGGYPIAELIFFRSFFGIIPATVLIFFTGGTRLLYTAQPTKQLMRASFWIVSFATYFYSLLTLTVADATALTFTAPLFLAALSGPLLGEKVHRLDWLAVAVGFLGVLVIINPSSGIFHIGAVFALISAVTYAGGSLSVRHMVRADAPATITFYSQLCATVVTLVFQPFIWKTPSLTDFLIIAGAGVVGGTAQLWSAQAIRYAPVGIIGPFIYTQMIWAVLFDYLIWSDLPGYTLMVGCAIIVCSSLSILYRHSRRRNNAVKPMNTPP